MKNIGAIDRTIRILVGLVALWLGYSYNPWWYVLAAIGLITGTTGYCWLYKLLGINAKSPTRKKKRK